MRTIRAVGSENSKNIRIHIPGFGAYNSHVKHWKQEVLDNARKILNNELQACDSELVYLINYGNKVPKEKNMNIIAENVAETIIKDNLEAKNLVISAYSTGNNFVIPIFRTLVKEIAKRNAKIEEENNNRGAYEKKLDKLSPTITLDFNALPRRDGNCIVKSVAKPDNIASAMNTLEENLNNPESDIAQMIKKNGIKIKISKYTHELQGFFDRLYHTADAYSELGKLTDAVNKPLRSNENESIKKDSTTPKRLEEELYNLNNNRRGIGVIQ
jgi:hypothetical protein